MSLPFCIAANFGHQLRMYCNMLIKFDPHNGSLQPDTYACTLRGYTYVFDVYERRALALLKARCWFVNIDSDCTKVEIKNITASHLTPTRYFSQQIHRQLTQHSISHKWLCCCGCGGCRARPAQRRWEQLRNLNRQTANSCNLMGAEYQMWFAYTANDCNLALAMEDFATATQHQQNIRDVRRCAA